MEGERAVDVVVVGAGLAGLCAARKLREAEKSVVVLEARDRVGGRTLSQPLGDDVIDLGAQWVGPDQRRVLDLAEELGIETFPQHHQGKKVMERKHSVGTHDEFHKAFSLFTQMELQVMVNKLDRLAKRVPLDTPYAFNEAREWDALSVEAWKNKNLWLTGARLNLDAVTQAVFGAEPRELSFLFFLFYLHSGRGFMSLTEVENAAQQDRFHGGSQQLSAKIAHHLHDAVRLNAPVRRIEHGASGVSVVTDSETFRGQYAIVAAPPPLAGRIDYDPPMPPLRDQLTQRMPMGSIIKCVAAYEKPFWREKGLSGEAYSEVGPIRITFDDSPDDGRQGALVGFMAGDTAREWTGRNPEKRQQAVLDAFARLFGDEARAPTAYVDHDWPAETWSRGCYEAFMAPGVMSSYGAALREPVGRIHWAGTETATEWTGYMEGAIQSGWRAAEEVLDRE